MTTTTVRPATVADLTWLVETSAALYRPEIVDYMIVAQPGIARYWEVLLAHPASYPDRDFLVAEAQDGELMGFADLVRVGPDTAHLSYLCVAESARGRGVATTLLREHLDRHPDLSRMQLDVVPDNIPARALYDRLGFATDSMTTWWVCDVPASGLAGHEPDRDAIVDGLHAARAWLDAYGFGELSVRTSTDTIKFGRPSRHVLRCFDISTLGRPDVLAAVLRELPEIDRLLLLAPGESAPPHEVGELRAVNTSLRMSSSDVRNRVGLS